MSKHANPARRIHRPGLSKYDYVCQTLSTRHAGPSMLVQGGPTRPQLGDGASMDLSSTGPVVSAGAVLLLFTLVLGVVLPAVWSRKARRRREATQVLNLLVELHLRRGAGQRRTHLPEADEEQQES